MPNVTVFFSRGDDHILTEHDQSSRPSSPHSRCCPTGIADLIHDAEVAERTHTWILATLDPLTCQRAGRDNEGMSLHGSEAGLSGPVEHV